MRLSRDTKLKKTEIAELLDVNRNTVYVWLKNGKLKDVTLGAVLDFVRQDSMISMEKDVMGLIKRYVEEETRDDKKVR